VLLATAILVFGGQGAILAAEAASSAKPGGKLKWLPYRPQTATRAVETAAGHFSGDRDNQVVPAGGSAAAESRQASDQGGPRRISSAMADPFGDMSPAAQQPGGAAQQSSLPPITGAAARGGEDPPAVGPSVLPTDPPKTSTGPTPKAGAGSIWHGEAMPLTAPEIEAGKLAPAGVLADKLNSQRCPTPKHEDFMRPITEVRPDIAPLESEQAAKRRERKVPIWSPEPDYYDGTKIVIPRECPIYDEKTPPIDARAARGFAPITFTWKASGLCHKPLYFEDVHLERYGHSLGPILQPVASGAHFFVTVPTLPYQMGLTPPWECIYTLGYYRPGSCAPYMLDPLPLSVRAGLLEAGVVTGLVFALP
jgi:hypothetical protein